MHSSDLNGALLAISQSLADRNQLTSTLDAVLAAARQLTFARHGIIYVLDQTGQSLNPSIVQHNDKAMTDHPWPSMIIDELSDSDPFGFAIRNGEVVLINDLYQYNGYDCETVYQSERAMQIQSSNLLAWPLIDHQQKSVGLLVLFALGAIDDEASLQAFTQIAATSIRQAIWLEQYGCMVKDLTADNAALNRENRQLKQRSTPGYDGPIAESESMLSVLKRVDKILPLPVDVLLRGETGAGKEVIAKYIHDNSSRASNPLVVQNCAAIPEQLLESELFGHKKGAFTGADKDKIGLFEAANGGTLFLDEIGDMPLLLQAKLLRVLQERKLRPVGSSSETDIDVRVIAATHCNLHQKIKNSEFRADLFYRLNVFPITLPPLRERRDDILPLAEHFLHQASQHLLLAQAPALSAKVRQQLLEYPYPGNVRELKNIVERSLLLSDLDTITTIDFGELVPDANEQHTARPEINLGMPLKDVVSQYERNVIIECLNACNWQTKRAAEQLSLPLSTLNHKMKKYEISPA